MVSNRCSICRKKGENCICEGCQTIFCVKHFGEHRQQRKAFVRYPLRTLRRCRGSPARSLSSVKPSEAARRDSVMSMQLDQDVDITHKELLEEINQAQQSKRSADIFSQIDRWENSTIDKVHKAAERARDQVTQLLNCDKETLTKQFKTLINEVNRRREENNFAKNEVKQLREQIHRLHQSLEQLIQSNESNVIIVENDQTDWNQVISVEKTGPAWPRHWEITANTRWTHNGVPVAGGRGKGDELNQLCYPYGLYVNDDQTAYIADFANHRIVKWKKGATSGQVVAGGNGPGNRNDQFNGPTDVIVDKTTDSLIICDYANRRVVRWPRQGGTSGETIIDNVKCWSLTMDDNQFLYVSDDEHHEVRRWRVGENRGTVVAGGNGPGARLNHPRYVFVDRDHSVFVSDWYNHRVMKWVEGAKRGIVVAGGQGQGKDLTQLSNPQGLIVDQLGTVYVADCWNHRVMRWPAQATQGTILVNGNEYGMQMDQPNYLMGLSFDRHGNLYVVDYGNHRVQKFSVDHDLCS